MNSEDLNRLRERSSGLVREGRLKENLALVVEALTDHRDDVDVVLLAANAHISEAPETTVGLANRASELAPEDPYVLMQASSSLLAVDALEDARRWCVKAMKLIDDDFPAIHDLSYLAGRIAVLEGKPDLAEQALTAPFEAHPEIEGYGLELGFLLESQHRWEEALVVAERALEHHPEDEELEALAIRCRMNLYGLDALPPGATLESE